MSDKIILSGMLPEEISSLSIMDTSFRGKQIFRWITGGERTFETMSNLPIALRQKLSEQSAVFSSRVAQALHDADGTLKLQIELYDNTAVEAVLLTDTANRKTACISSQVGCPMNCAFCQTGHIGYTRNLTANEIIEQFYHIEDRVGKLDNIVFMGMGEPMLNLPEIRKAIAILTHPDGIAFSRRRITISTAGICAGIYSLANEGPHVRLAVSLTTANPELRSQLMPVNNTDSLDELRKAIHYFSSHTGDRVTLELALLAHANTMPENAREVARFAERLNVHINLIPWNPVATLPFQSPDSNEVYRFYSALTSYGLNVTIRSRKGVNIGGACGQLGKTNPA